MWYMGSKNWIRYGWGTPLSKTRVTTENLVVDMTNNGIPIEKMSPFDASIIAIKDIVTKYPGPYTLMCSGGIDSQAMLWCWKQSKVPFTVVSVKYESNGITYNEHDLETLDEFTSKIGVPVVYKKFDVITFLENELSTVAYMIDCDSPQINTYIKMSKMIADGTVVFSGNFITGKLAGINYTILGLHRYSLMPSVSCVPFFFLQTPELAYSMRPYNPKTPTNENYGSNYISAGFPIIKQPQKYTGFEKLKEYYDKYTKEVPIALRIKAMNKPSKRIFDILFRYPYTGVSESWPPLLLTID